MSKYTAATYAELRKAMPGLSEYAPNNADLDEVLDGLALADKMTKGLPPANAEEAKLMGMIRTAVDHFDNGTAEA